MSAAEDVEAQRHMAKAAFNEPGIRQAFIRKVCFIEAGQLTVTFGAMIVTVKNQQTKLWISEHKYLLLFAIILFITSICLMVSYNSARKEAPYNFIALGMVTCALAVFLTFLTFVFSSEVILLAVGITAVVICALTLFALQTKIDVTTETGALFVLLVIFLIFSIVRLYVPSKTASFFKASIGVTLFSILLIYNIQLMTRGENSIIILTPNDYVFAAVCLYMDIVLIFIFILGLLGIDV